MGKKYYDSYDYEDIYNKEVLGEETEQEIIERIARDIRKCKLVVKTIQSGTMLESEVYPVYSKKREMPKTEKKSETNI